MIRTNKSLGLAAGILLGLSVTSQAQAEVPVAADILAHSCFSCHGYDGKPAGGPIPPLSFFPADHIERQMLDFKYDRRPGTIMSRHAKSYTDEEIKIMSRVLGR